MKLESLEYPLGDVELGEELGGFYQDFSEAIALVDSGYHGDFDADGIPRAMTSSGPVYSAILTSQYALASFALADRGERARGDGARVLLDSLVRTLERDGELRGTWPMSFDNAKYPWLTAPWISALASGNALSALLRGWQRYGEPSYRDAADLAYEGLHRPGRAMRILDEDGADLWYEEYPAKPPLRVLNGHIYALLGVADYARVSGEKLAHERWRRAAETVRRSLSGFDLGYWSAYDIGTREPATIHYHKNIHIPQMRILEALTGAPEFGAAAARWESQLTSRYSHLRWQIAIRAHRWRPRPVRTAE